MTRIEADTVAEIFGAPRIAERFADLTREIPGLSAGQIEVEPDSAYVDRPLSETRAAAAVGAFLVGLTLTGEVADRARAVLSPLRDLFAAAFFVAIGLSVDPRALLPLLVPALTLAAVTAVTKVATGVYVASRDTVGRRGQLRAGTILIARGEFSIVIIGLAGTAVPGLSPLITAYVFALAVTGPLITRLAGTAAPARAAAA
ncbi:MAG: cation:proton antiporter [Pseudonocardiaceae bacterium]